MHLQNEIYDMMERFELNAYNRVKFTHKIETDSPHMLTGWGTWFQLNTDVGVGGRVKLLTRTILAFTHTSPLAIVATSVNPFPPQQMP